MRVYLDDERPMPEYFDTLVRTAEEAIALLKTGKVHTISLDHDLGTELTGYDVAKYIEKAVITGEIEMMHVLLHTHNPVGKENMRKAIYSAKLFVMEKRKNENQDKS